MPGKCVFLEQFRDQLSKERIMSKKKMTKKQRDALRKKRQRRRVVLFVVEILLFAILGTVAYGVVKLDKLDYTILDQKKLEVYKDTGPYTNIALFGLDSRDAELGKGTRSDTIMICSINNETGDVKIASVFRDTLMQQQDGTYEKANAAYSYGGPEEAISLLNRNLDLDIKNYMSVNFNALVDVIDLLGGIELDLTWEEVYWLNGYVAETAEAVGKEGEFLEGQGGHEKLNGIQAVSYARVRYTAGDDYRRAERQRVVLQTVVEKAQKASIGTLNKIVDKVFPQVSTSLSATQLMGVAANALNYKIGETSGFPFDVTTSEKIRKHEGSYVVAIGFADNVKQLHKFLFGEENYEPSDKVNEIDKDIIYLSGVDPEDYIKGASKNMSDSSGSDNSDDSDDNAASYKSSEDDEDYSSSDEEDYGSSDNDSNDDSYDEEAE